MAAPNLISISFQNQTDIAIDTHQVELHLERILRRLNQTVRLNTEVIFVGDKKIAELNGQYRQVNAPTDVLSFETPAAERGTLLGSVVVSLETAQKQAQEAGIALLDEVKTLTGHGLLHLLGYHHR